MGVWWLVEAAAPGIALMWLVRAAVSMPP